MDVNEELDHLLSELFATDDDDGVAPVVIQRPQSAAWRSQLLRHESAQLCARVQHAKRARRQRTQCSRDDYVLEAILETEDEERLTREWDGKRFTSETDRVHGLDCVVFSITIVAVCAVVCPLHGRSAHANATYANRLWWRSRQRHWRRVLAWPLHCDSTYTNASNGQHAP